MKEEMLTMSVTLEEREFLLNRRAEQARHAQAMLWFELLEDAVKEIQSNGVKLWSCDVNTGAIMEFQNLWIDKEGRNLHFCHKD